MKLRLGAAVILAALTPLTAVTAPSPASAGVDVTPPEVGSCHYLTYEEAYESSDPDPEVDCRDRHTSLTIDVIEFAEAPDWNDPASFQPLMIRRCNRAWFDALGGNPKSISRSSYTWYWFRPTRAQRDAGAAWVRCDLALLAGDQMMRIPQDVALGTLPLPDAVAKCREGKRADYLYTVCARPHQFRATISIRYPHSSYPGARAAKAFAHRKCEERMSTAYFYEWVVSRYWWRMGFRHALCLPKTSD